MMDTPVATPAPAPSADATSAPNAAPETNVSSEGGAEPTPAPAAEPTPAPAAEPERRRHKVKVDGEELEIDEDELKAGYQSRKASQKAWQAAADQKKQIVELFRRIKTNPREGLQALLSRPEIGHDLKKIATDLLTEEIQREQMTPEQREAEDMRRELEKYRSEKEKAEKEQLDAQTAALKREYAQRVEQEVVDAIKPSGLPMTKYTFKRVVFYLKEGHARGYKLTAADVVPLVKQDYETEHRAFFSGYDDEALEKALGDEVAERLSKRRIARLKGQQPSAPALVAEPAIEESAPAEKPKPKPKPPARKETFAEAAARIARGGK